VKVPNALSIVGVADIHGELDEGEVYSQSIQFQMMAAAHYFQSASRGRGRRASTFLMNQAWYMLREVLQFILEMV